MSGIPPRLSVRTLEDWTNLVGRVLFSLLALFFALLHAFAPDKLVDSTTVILLAFGALPWLGSLVEYIKFPGGEVKYKTTAQTLSVAIAGLSEQANRRRGMTSEAERTRRTAPRFAIEATPVGGLLALRAGIESRLRKLAEVGNVDPDQHVDDLIDQGWKGGMFDKETAAALGRIIRIANQAAHGARVPPDVAELVSKQGPLLLRLLDDATGL